MTEGFPWSVKGVEPDIRHDAVRAASAAGITLGQWLNGVLRDTLVDIQAARGHAAPLRPSHEPYAMPASGTGPSFPQQAQANPTMPPFQQPYPYAQPHQGHAAHPFGGPPYAQPYPPPYEAYAWQPPHPAPYAAPRPYDPLDARLQHYARPAPVQDDRLMAVIDALAGIVERAQQPAVHTAQPAAPVQAAPVPAQTSQPQRTDDASGQLDALMQRLAALEASIASRQEARGDSLAEARRIESQLGDALDALSPETPPVGGISGVRSPPGRTAVRPRINVVRGGAAVAVADIAARQRSLELDGAPRALMNAENQALEQIRRSIAALADQVREAKAEQSPTFDVRSELKSLQTSVQELAPRRIVASVNESIRALAGQIEQSRAEGVRDNQLQPIEKLLGDLRRAVEQPREIPGLANISAAVSQLARKVEDISAKAPAPSQAGEFQRHFAEIRAMIAQAHQQIPTAAISDQLAHLTGKLDDLAQRPGDARAMAQVTATVDQLRQDLTRFNPERVVALIHDRTAGLDGLGQQIESLSARLEEAQSRPTGQLHVDALSQQIERMTQALAQHKPGADVSRLADSIDGMRHDLASRPALVDLSAVENRIAEVHSLLEHKIPTQPDVKGLELILRKLAERIEAVRAPVASDSALDALQSQIMALAQRLDHAGPASTGLAELAGLERTISDLCRVVGDVRDTAAHAAQDAVREAMSQSAGFSGAGGDPLAAEGLLLIKRDLTEMKSAQSAAESRSRDTLLSVGSTLEKIVSRLGMLETGLQTPRNALRAEPEPPALAAQPAAAAVSVPQPRPAPVRQEPPPLMASLAAAGEPGSDMPLEPGVGRAGVPATIILPGSDATVDPRTNFIAAARRAAKSAATQTTAALAEAEKKAGGRDAIKAVAAGKMDGIKATLLARRKPILLSLAVFFIAMGGLRIVSSLLGPDETVPEISAPVQVKPQSSLGRDSAPPSAGELSVVAPRQSAAVTPAVDPVTVGSISEPPQTVQPRAVVAPQLVPVTPPPAQPVDVAVLLKQTNFAGPDRLKQAAMNGSLPAIHEIGARFADGRGVQRDLKTAARWLEHAAGQGFAPAQYRFGSFNREGLGVQQDAKTAFVWFMRAAEQGHILAMHNLAVLYAEGVTGSPDYAAAASWFRNAADHGVKDSQFNIAILHVRGLGVAQDPAEAYKWFAVAGGQGDPDGLKRRDELASKLTPDQLAEGKKRVEDFRAKRPDMRINDVAAPEGGWDQATKPATTAKKNVRT